MATPLWAKLVSDFIGGDVVVFPSGLPTTDDCAKAKADYVVDAPFDLRPRLPGIPYSSDRIPAQTHITVTNCLTGALLFDRTINIDSDPQANQPEGDLESVPEISWNKSVPAALRKYSLTFPRVAHVVRLDPPFAYVDIAEGSVRVGQGLRVFARADRTRLAQPIILTIASVDGKYAEVQFSMLPGAQRPGVGDLVEPIDDTAPRASASPSAQPRSVPQAAATTTATAAPPSPSPSPIPTASSR
jgi:hypothetical protein